MYNLNSHEKDAMQYMVKIVCSLNLLTNEGGIPLFTILSLCLDYDFDLPSTIDVQTAVNH